MLTPNETFSMKFFGEQKSYSYDNDNNNNNYNINDNDNNNNMARFKFARLILEDVSLPELASTP
jgi:hypothetical protein